jgi:DNA-nicking Smr family endonuclease
MGIKEEHGRILAHLDHYGIVDKDKSAYRPKTQRKKTEISERGQCRTIDLHGMRTDEAESALRMVIGTCRDTGARQLKVIHGYGAHSSPNGEFGILRTLVRNMLETELCSAIKSHRPGGFKDGGDGVTVVYFR